MKWPEISVIEECNPERTTIRLLLPSARRQESVAGQQETQQEMHSKKLKTREGINEGINGGINEGIKQLVATHPGIRVPQIARIVQKSKQTIERVVSRLKKEGEIEHRGSKKTGGYYVRGGSC